MNNKRRHERLDCKLTGYLIDLSDVEFSKPAELFVPVEILNASGQGLRIKTSLDLPESSFVYAFIIYDGEKSMSFCSIRWKKYDKPYFTYGLFFKEWDRLDLRLQHKLYGNKKLSPSFQWGRFYTALKKKIAA